MTFSLEFNHAQRPLQTIFFLAEIFHFREVKYFQVWRGGDAPLKLNISVFTPLKGGGYSDYLFSWIYINGWSIANQTLYSGSSWIFHCNVSVPECMQLFLQKKEKHRKINEHYLFTSKTLYPHLVLFHMPVINILFELNSMIV